VHPAASPVPHDLIDARSAINEAQRIIDQSRCSGPAIEQIARELAHLVWRMRSLEETWFE
jgi:hypothetical protein